MPDDLRAAIEEAVSAYTEPDTLGHRVERVLEILADPVRRLAILDAMGLDVREARLVESPGGKEFFDVGPRIYFDELSCLGDVPVLVCRVRQQQEQADG